MAGDLAGDYAGTQVRGEIVLVIAPPDGGVGEAVDIDAVLTDLLATASVSRAAAAAAELTGLAKNRLYKRALELSQQDGAAPDKSNK